MKKKLISMGKDHRGITMVELMVIVAIMLVVTGSVINLGGYLNGKQARQCAYKLEAALSEIRTETMSKSTGELESVYFVLENTGGNIYAKQIIKGNERSDLIGEQVEVLVTDSMGISSVLENGSQAYIYFDRASGGLAEQAVRYTQIEIIQGITTYIVEIEPETGRIECRKK